MLSDAVHYFFQIVIIALLIYAVLTWIPGVNWLNEPFKTLRGFSELFFAPFRGLVPPINDRIDISPIVALFVLSILARIIVWILSVLHL